MRRQHTLPSHPAALSDVVVMCVSAGRHGNEIALTSSFKNSETGKKLKTEKHTVYVHMDEASVAGRKHKVRGAKSLSCMDMLYVITGSPLVCTDGPRLHYRGSNQSNVLGPVVLPSHDEIEQVTFAHKKKMLGKFRFEVGGKTDGCEGRLQRADEDLEPISFHAFPREIYESLSATFGVSCWIDLTAMTPALATVAVCNRTPYVGITFSPEHSEWLVDKVAANLFTLMQDSTHPLYKADLVKILSKANLYLKKSPGGTPGVKPPGAKPPGGKPPGGKPPGGTTPGTPGVTPPGRNGGNAETPSGRKPKAKAKGKKSGLDILKERLASMRAGKKGAEAEEEDPDEEEDDAEEEEEEEDDAEEE